MVDPEWSAARIKESILQQTQELYGSSLNIYEVQSSMDEIWEGVIVNLNQEEKARLDEIAHISVPLGDLNAKICLPPSRQGYYILFDATLDLRLVEIFTAPRNPAAWAASHINAAWSHTIPRHYWIEEGLERLQKLDPRSGVPDSYMVTFAREFVYAHELGHLFLNHLTSSKHFDNSSLKSVTYDMMTHQAFSPELQQEMDADAFARELLCRSGKTIIGQQMGVDWFFGFIITVLQMRLHEAALRKQSTLISLEVIEGIKQRRNLCWQDYAQRWEETHIDEKESPKNLENLEVRNRLRKSVDNFNDSGLPLILAEIHSRLPEELMQLHAQVQHEPLDKKALSVYFQSLNNLYNESRRMAARHYPKSPDMIGQFFDLLF